ncbi:MAG: terpene cyclase/mutase family protein [Nitrospirae bacterium]|nr:terpene cyclase/mutase family protein [Candidatus Troglogloeales bacterium]
MQAKQLTKLCLGILRHPFYTTLAFGSYSKTGMPDLAASVRRGADWLLKAQENAPDGQGYSRRYSLITGWDRCYIETTGYIVPTLLNVSQYLGATQYRESAIRAANWLLTVQTAEGAFTDIDAYTPQVFDTGQVLLGFNRMFRDTRDERFLSALIKAGRWLTDVQEVDGSWVRFAYNNRPHAYYSRVAAALIEAGQIAGIEEYVAAGTRNLEWVAAQRQANGYFRFSEFKPGEDAILHTIVYVLEGFSMAFDLTAGRRWADMLIDGAEVLARLSNEDGFLYSQYDPEWGTTNMEYCVTGLAQYAGICFDVANIVGDVGFRDRGSRIVENLCRWQQDKGRDITGTLQSSVPLWGYYGGMEFFNWNIKFFLDAVLKNLGAPVK